MQGRDYNDLVRRVEALDSDGMAVDVLGEASGYPVFRVRISADETRPTFLVNAGTHGDEPAGVEAALSFLEDGCGAWTEHLQIEVVPCLSPFGYVNNSRTNEQAVDINWSFKRDDVPEVGIFRQLVADRVFEGVMDLHEDWESPGYYLYEMTRDTEPVGPRVTKEVSRICPINRQPEIEGEKAVNGVIFPNMEIRRRREGDGIPVALFQCRHTDHLITSETPTSRDLPERVAAHLRALSVMIQHHAPNRDLSKARVKPEYVINPEDVVEPSMSPDDWRDFEEGVDLFNRGLFWESHESWERVWRRHPEPSRIFFQGLIQAAAAHHQFRRGIRHGVIKHFNNALSKLDQFPGRFLGVDVTGLRESMRTGLEEILRDEKGSSSVTSRVEPKVAYRRPAG